MVTLSRRIKYDRKEWITELHLYPQKAGSIEEFEELLVDTIKELQKELKKVRKVRKI